MTEFLSVSLTSRPPRVALLVPDPGLTAHKGQPWQAVMFRAIETACLYWGGAETFFVPVNEKGTVNALFIELLRQCDPDFILAYAPTADSIARSLPSTERPWETSEADEPPAQLDSIWADNALEMLLDEFPSHRLPSLADHYLHPTMVPPRPLTPVAALYADGPASPSYMSGSSDVPGRTDPISMYCTPSIETDLALLVASRTGLTALVATSAGYRTRHTDLPANILNIDLDAAVDIAILGRPLTGGAPLSEMHSSPSARTLIGADADVTRGVTRLARTLVVGDSLEDLCFALGLQVTYGRHFALWLPSSIRPPHQSEAVVGALTRWLQILDIPSRITSVSLSEQHVADAVTEVAALPKQPGSAWYGPGASISIRAATSTDAATFPPSRHLRAISDVLDVQRSLPFRDGVSIEAAAAPIPAMDAQVAGPLDWITDAWVDGCRPWPRPATAMLASVDESPESTIGDVAELSRPARDGISWVAVDHRSPVQTFLPIEHQLRRLRLVDVDLTAVISAAAAAALFRTNLSNAARLYSGTIEMFGSLRNAASAFADSATRGVLDSYLMGQDKSSPSQNYGVWLAASRRRAFRLSDLRKALRANTISIDTHDMRDLLDGLIAKGILRSGYVLKCERCLHTDFYPLGSVSTSFRCARCLIEQRLNAASWCKVPPHQPALFHALDELVYQSLANGIAGPVLALRSLQRSTPNRGFRFALPHTFTRLGESSPFAEIDFAVLRDGAMAIGEAKLNGELGKTAHEARAAAVKLRKLAMDLRVEEVVFWAPRSSPWDKTSRDAIDQTFETRSPFPTILET